MANPYENDTNLDPFRERPASQPPTTMPAGQRSPINDRAVPSYGDAQPETAYPHKPDFSGTTAVPMENAPVPPAATAAAEAAQEAPKPTSKFWTTAFWQQYFDVNTRQVLIRMSNTLVPINPPDFLFGRNWHYNDSQNGAAAAPQDGDLVVDGVTLSRKPDLYGPFWICTTLWMVVAIVSNVMGRIAATKANRKDWHYDFSVASVACAVMYLYCFVFGSIVWGIMTWRNLPVSVVDTICLYGYSMFIFVLTALLCMVPSIAAQWVFCILGGVWSTAYLIINFWHMWKNSLERNWFIGIVALVALCHFGLTLSFKFYFFNYSS